MFAKLASFCSKKKRGRHWRGGGACPRRCNAMEGVGAPSFRNEVSSEPRKRHIQDLSGKHKKAPLANAAAAQKPFNWHKAI